MKTLVLLVAFISIASAASAQQPQSVFDETGDVHLTTVPVPKEPGKWVTLISVTPKDSYGGGVDKWMWLSHPGAVATPQDLLMRGRVVFDGEKVTVNVPEQPPIVFNFNGANAPHLIGAWRARRDMEPTSHERLVASMLGTFARNGG